MIGGLARFLLLRVLPRRLVPLLAFVEIVRLLRAVRRGRSRERVEAGDPRVTRSR